LTRQIAEIGPALPAPAAGSPFTPVLPSADQQSADAEQQTPADYGGNRQVNTGA
jgi:hypothetical protein